MVERKSTAAKNVPDKTPAGRFYDLQQEVAPRKPYVLTEDITIPPVTRSQLKALEQAAGDDDAQDRILFGEHFDAITALFADLPVDMWQAFTKDINRHLFGLGVEQTPGKSGESSDS